MDQPTAYVVDASAVVRDGLKMLLEDMDIKVKHYANEKDFLDEPLPLSTPRCLIVDLYVAGLNGIELMQHLQRHGTPTPTIILASDSDIPTAVRALQAGAVDFIEKPFVDCVLIERVRHALTLTTFREQSVVGE